ncbi:MAG: threonine--tRNA ligase [Candidatus Diapherotrites archaeon]|nr:threonine--tRNA ligase [Candidatus Diapherotrites archaeon]
MKILTIHSDFIEVEPKKKAIKDAEEVEKEKKRIEECLVVFSAVEAGDEGNQEEVSEKTVGEIAKVASEVKTKRIVLYPFVHLTSKPSKPAVAISVLDDVTKLLSKQGFEVYKAPFGWYKAFNLKCKGHPLAELSREIRLGDVKGEESRALKAERKLSSHWFILDTDGKMHELSMKDGKVSGYEFEGNAKLEKLAAYEMAKSRLVKMEPPHVQIMKKLELVDYEEGSDPGNLRFLPKGKLIKSLLEDWISESMGNYGAMEVETPIMYDYEHPALKNYLQRFPARQYVVQSPNKRLFLRFSACFGQFLLAKDATISYKDMPVRVYELAKSFRAEKRGELTGLRRLRAFTMPDCHALCIDFKQAREELLKRFELARNIESGIGFGVPDDFELAIRVVKSFFEENEDYVKGLVKRWGKPALIELWDKQFFYFVMKHEWNFVDALGKASALTTDQIDVENAERYGLSFVNKAGKKEHPLILHFSPGAVERIMYALLEKAHMQQEKGIKPSLPVWLCPTQVRICPVSEGYLKPAVKLLKKIKSAGIRVDIDDRELTIGKKVRDAEKEWIPFILVFGEKEKNGSLSVRTRNGSQEKYSVEGLVDKIKHETKDMPFRQLPLPETLSRRPVFIG